MPVESMIGWKEGEEEGEGKGWGKGGLRRTRAHEERI